MTHGRWQTAWVEIEATTMFRARCARLKVRTMWGFSTWRFHARATGTQELDPQIGRQRPQPHQCVAEVPTDLDVHLICDNLRHSHPRLQVHVAGGSAGTVRRFSMSGSRLTSTSWLNMSPSGSSRDLTDKRPAAMAVFRQPYGGASARSCDRRGASFTTTTIAEAPFIWTKKASDILMRRSPRGETDLEIMPELKCHLV